MQLYNLGGLKSQRRWTKLAKECYSINCICEKCSFIPEDLKKRCFVKSYVLALYRKFGKPEGVENEVD